MNSLCLEWRKNGGVKHSDWFFLEEGVVTCRANQTSDEDDLLAVVAEFVARLALPNDIGKDHQFVSNVNGNIYQLHLL